MSKYKFQIMMQCFTWESKISPFKYWEITVSFLVNVGPELKVDLFHVNLVCDDDFKK